jgi:hypothetical protein
MAPGSVESKSPRSPNFSTPPLWSDGLTTPVDPSSNSAVPTSAVFSAAAA